MNQMARIVVDPGGCAARFTTAEFRRMCEAGAFEDMKVELIDGELHRMVLPWNEHGRLQAQVMGQIWTALGEEARRRACGGIGIDLGGNTVLRADAAILATTGVKADWPTATDLTLVVEVADTTLGRDLGIKQARYAAAGVPNYWVINSAGRVIHSFAGPADGAYARSEVVRFGEPVVVPGTSHGGVIQ